MQDKQKEKEALERECNRLTDQLNHLKLSKEDATKQMHSVKEEESSLKVE